MQVSRVCSLPTCLCTSQPQGDSRRELFKLVDMGLESGVRFVLNSVVHKNSVLVFFCFQVLIMHVDLVLRDPAV